MIQLYINGTLADISEDTNVSLNRQFESLSKPTNYYSDFSKTVELPMTPNNKAIFSNFNRQDSLVTNTTIDPREKIPYVLLWNGKLLMDGYLRLANANTIYTDRVYDVELYGYFGLVMNELAQITFNPYEIESNGGEVEDKYLIETPFNKDAKINRTLVKRSWEQTSHNIDGDDILDYIKFVPSYQGKYDDFNSQKVQSDHAEYVELSQERDEHYFREFRSYYQQPAIWVDKLWWLAKKKIKELTDYDLVLDSSWFNNTNPYWKDLLYTCPSLFNSDPNFQEYITYFGQDRNHCYLNFAQQSELSQIHSKKLWFDKMGDMYNTSTGVFNEDKRGASQFSNNSRICLLAYNKNNGYEARYARIRNDNPLFVKFQAVNAVTNEAIEDAEYTYMLYSGSTNYEDTDTYNEKIDVETTYSMVPNMDGGYPTGYDLNDGYWWEANINVQLTIKENVPYYIVMSSWWANNGKGCEYSTSSLTAHWDWLWLDFFYIQSGAPSGYAVIEDMTSAEVTTIDYNRSDTNISMYRVFPKDTTLYNVLLNYTKVFGLLWDVDEDSKKVTVMNHNKYFKNYKVYDWSDKVDRSKDFVLEPITFDKRYVRFNVEEGSGQRYENYYDKYNIGYGAKRLDTKYQFNKDTEDLYENLQPSIISQKAQFSKLINTEYPDQENFMGYGYKIYPNEHYIENDNEGSNAGNSGAFFFCNGSFEPDPRLSLKGFNRRREVLITDDTYYMIVNDEYFWNNCLEGVDFCNYIPDISTVSKDGKYSIHFAEPKEYFFKVDNRNTKYVYDLFWKKWINEQYNVQNKKLTAYFYITPKDYSEISFKDFVMLDNVLYHINKIEDFDFDANAPTKCELVQVWDLSAYTEGQEYFPYLNTDHSVIELTYGSNYEINVDSSSDWSVTSSPTWVDYTIDGDVLTIIPRSALIARKVGFLTLENTDGLTTTLLLSENATAFELTLSRNGWVARGEGATLDLGINSNPSTLTVESKPSWVSVMLLSHIGGMLDYTYSARISMSANPSSTARSGFVTFTNGNLSKKFRVTQLGNNTTTDQNDDTVIIASADNDNVIDIATPDEIDDLAVGITSGTAYVSNKVGTISVTFKPTLGEDETVGGGQIRLLKKDGSVIMKNYNVGEVLNTYTVIVSNADGGTVDIDGTEYSGTFYSTYTKGSTLTIKAEPSDGYTFSKWSDGVTDNPRTITVTENMTIYPIFE